MSGLSNGSTQAFQGSQFQDGAGYVNDPLSSSITQFMSTTIPAAFAPLGVQFLANITQLTGTDYTALASVPTTALSTPFIVSILVSGVFQTWVLVAGTSAGGAGICLPNDYNAITNSRYWIQLQ